jgi:hypothetical protein
MHDVLGMVTPLSDFVESIGLKAAMVVMVRVGEFDWVGERLLVPAALLVFFDYSDVKLVRQRASLEAQPCLNRQGFLESVEDLRRKQTRILCWFHWELVGE